MIHLFKTNYQQVKKKKKEKKDYIPRQQKGNQVYQSCFWAPFTYHLAMMTFEIVLHRLQGEKEEKTPQSYPLFLQNYLKNRSALLLQGY